MTGKLERLNQINKLKQLYRQHGKKKEGDGMESIANILYRMGSEKEMLK